MIKPTEHSKSLLPLLPLLPLLRPLCALALGLFTLTALQGCIEVAVGSAVIGTLAATDRRTFGAQTEDKAIGLKSSNKITSVVGNNGHVNANSFNRRVLLTGEVKDETLKAAIEREIAAIEGVQTVVNELSISGSSSLTSRSSDTLTTGKVKTALVDAKDIQANTIKVITESGVVYLMGRVSQNEGKIAADKASTVGGVRKVIKVFEYISEEAAKEYSKSPPPVDNNRN